MTIEAHCPSCGTPSRRKHSHYERRLLDTAAGGQEVLIHLRVHRFFCSNDACDRHTFAEQVPNLTIRYGRRSIVAGQALRGIALALGGRAGARLAARLALAVSRMTLIRLIRALPEPVLQTGPAVLGVDDFALQGWVLAANLGHDLDCWLRLLVLHDQDDLERAEPDTMRYRLYHLPARLSTHARRRHLRIERTWPWAQAFVLAWQRLTHLPVPA
ncbi:transposase family protein [Nonomuraea sp. H19]|uniref:transposase family protein n=1 Tax=Nonomuraea sp. H19 TaxID=3452206 RepID=UPI003F8AA1A8